MEVVDHPSTKIKEMQIATANPLLQEGNGKEVYLCNESNDKWIQEAK